LDNLDKLRDIKPIVAVPDDSLYIFILCVVLAIIVIAFLLYFIYKKSKKEKYIFDLNDAKKTAYQLIEIIRDKEDSKEYIDKLHQYTYKKEVPPFDKELFKEIVKKFKIDYL